MYEKILEILTPIRKAVVEYLLTEYILEEAIDQVINANIKQISASKFDIEYDNGTVEPVYIENMVVRPRQGYNKWK